ncbi:F-box domain containing protein [Trema orientale]|uniref:F-box domain containing protein n=1 Tax=Trema orientale TaxID=63057 RepID=A0A2P5CAG4_TREOI|nr:F-box domain containing protein [Trema orientale]
MVTKRRRKTSYSTKRRKRETSYDSIQIDNNDKQNQRLDPSITDLPLDILANILLRLSATSIITCKRVCKTWRDLILDPTFAKHAYLVVQENTTILFRDIQSYLIEPKNDPDFHPGFCHCESMFCRPSCHSSDINLETRLKVPLCKTNVMTTSENVRKVRLSRYSIVNSCNGLLCLISRQDHHDPVVVCNPITGEFIHISNILPESSDSKHVWVSDVFGLGFSPKNNHYKVIRMISHWDPDSPCRTILEAEVYTLGAGSRKKVDNVPFPALYLQFHTYLNGVLYWLSNIRPTKIFSFDLDMEQFHLHNVPSGCCRKRLTMGVLGGSLYVCESETSDHVRIGIWVMEKYGDRNSWTKLFTIEEYGYYGGPRDGSFRPISYLNNGTTLLLVHSPSNKLIHYHLTGLNGVKSKSIWICGRKMYFQVIVHTPSFISLKDILMEANTN